jgi:hypothetical protein
MSSTALCRSARRISSTLSTEGRQAGSCRWREEDKANCRQLSSPRSSHGGRFWSVAVRKRSTSGWRSGLHGPSRPDLLGRLSPRRTADLLEDAELILHQSSIPVLARFAG